MVMSLLESALLCLREARPVRTQALCALRQQLLPLGSSANCSGVLWDRSSWRCTWIVGQSVALPVVRKS